MYKNSVKITNKEAKSLISNRPVILVNDSNISNYTDNTNYYNSGVYGWNYSIAYNNRLDCYVICGYRIPNSVLNSASEIKKLSQEEAKI